MNDQISHFTLLGSPYEETENDTMDDLYERYKLDPAGIGTSKGRNPVTDPRVLFKVLAYASEIHIYSNRQIVDACENRIDMIWLLDGEPVPDQSTIARFKQRCASEIEDLFYQYARLLEKQEETDHLMSRATHVIQWRSTKGSKAARQSKPPKAVSVRIAVCNSTA